MTANDTKLVVRLPQDEKRHIKSLAARQGLTLRQAILQAFQAWELQLASRALPVPAQVRPADADMQKPGQPKRAATPRQDRRPADEGRSVTPSGGQVPQQEGPSRTWLRGAAQLDWSKCPAAERVQGKTGSVWVARGTRVPLAAILDAVAEGEPFVEIAEVFEITLQQLIAVLQFAAEGAAPAGPAK